MIIDTHLHLIDKSALAYPWLATTPALDRDFLYETYRQEAERCGISACLHMEVDVDPEEMETETRYVETLANQPGNLIIGAIAPCRPEQPDFPDYLEAQLQNPFVKGFRRVLHVMPDTLSDSALFRDNIKRIGGTGLSFDLCVLPHQIPRAMALADLAPDVQFVLDHCGVPDIRSGETDVWREGMTAIARRPNVACKISGVIAYADAQSWTAETIRPYVETTIEHFGWQRVVWGSDWPVCTLGGGLSTWVSTTHALLAGASKGERDALLFANACRLWKLEHPAGS